MGQNISVHCCCCCYYNNNNYYNNTTTTTTTTTTNNNNNGHHHDHHHRQQHHERNTVRIRHSGNAGLANDGPNSRAVSTTGPGEELSCRRGLSSRAIWPVILQAWHLPSLLESDHYASADGRWVQAAIHLTVLSRSSQSATSLTGRS